MARGNAGRFASAVNLLSRSTRFLVERARASAIVGAMGGAGAKHLVRQDVRSVGVSERDCERIAPAYAYAGFRGQQEA